MNNVTFRVASSFECDKLSSYTDVVNTHHPIWKQTLIGCAILRLLRHMYGFNLTYVPENLESNLTVIGEDMKVSIFQNQSVDLFVRPLGLRENLLDDMYPVHAAYLWRYGFILSRYDDVFFRTFYSQPFSQPVWYCVYIMAFFISVLLYFLKRWEFGIMKGWECSYSYEMLMIIGAYCQHIPPIEARLPSRRIAYFILFVFAYTVYTFYTSNLLSHLVNDKDLDITLDELAATNIECAIVNYMSFVVSDKVSSFENINNSLIMHKLRNLRSVSVPEGFDGVKSGQMALLSDYISLYAYIRTSLTSQEICKLSKVDLFTNIKKYFFVSKQFIYKEQFKIATLRIREAGIFDYMLAAEFQEPSCAASKLVQTNLMQISTPILILFIAYVLSVFIMIGERIYYRRHKVWPYVN